MRLDQNLHQNLTMTPQLRQSVEILQLGSEELTQLIKRACEENPLLEIGDPSREDAAARLRWLREQRRAPQGSIRAAENPLEAVAGQTDHISLQDSLLLQCNMLHLAPSQKKAVRYLIGLLEPDGYLKIEAPEAFRGEFEVALSVLQSMDPPGVGARNLAECLSLQLKRNGHFTPLHQSLLENDMLALSQGKFAQLAAKYGVSKGRVTAYFEEIRQLDPKPGAIFYKEERESFLVPDLIVTEEAGELQVQPVNWATPQLLISQSTYQLLENAEEQEAKTYLEEQLKRAKWVLHCITARQETLLRVASQMVSIQRRFFLTGKQSTLKPLSLEMLANSCALHPSTISRAVQEKYITCRFGTFPLKQLLVRQVASRSGQVGTIQVKEAILALVSQEDGQAPLQDDALTKELNLALGTALTRRTIAKYRGELGLPIASKRKKAGDR